MKHILHAKVKKLGIRDGEELIVVLNEIDALNYGLNAFDKVEILKGKDTLVVNLDTTKELVRVGEVGIFDDVLDKISLENNSLVNIKFTKRSNTSVNAIRKKMQGKAIDEKEINSIIKDISQNKMIDSLMTYYVASSFFYPTSNKEMYLTAKAMAENGIMFKYPKFEIVADKHCIGGVPGNETTMILIPLIASLGIKIPKNFSKAITSPAATGECVSVLMDISFDKKGIEKLIKKNNCCLVRGGSLDLAPADDTLIQIQYPLSMQNIAKVVSSIMAKKYAMGITHSLIDIPMGPTAKVKNMKEAKEWKKKFEIVGKGLGMKMSVQITDAKQPIGAGIGAVLQVREVLRVLQQHEKRPDDLEKKAVFLASKIIENVGMAKGKEAEKLAYGQLVSGEAWKYMQKIIKAQNGKNPDQKSEELKLAKNKKEILVEKSGTVKNIDMKFLNDVCRTLGAPLDLKAGIYLDNKVGDKVKKGDVLCTFYSDDELKINLALKMMKKRSFYEIK
ncbi:MAG TPA: thymidine phosphorylase [Candidatus Absconditabacterales bacterium]|nr:thymidine phosphorylase [Candidatus Absconditabacterales bacterium]